MQGGGGGGISRVGVGGEGGLSFFFVWRYTVLRKGEACERRGGGYIFNNIVLFFSSHGVRLWESRCHPCLIVK